MLLIAFAFLLGILVAGLLFYFGLSRLAAKALLDNNQSFLNLAQTGFLAPFKESLQFLNEHLRELEKSREVAYHTLQQQVSLLRSETQSLSRALTSQSARGRWGELQLKRVVELAGMLAHCDFQEQMSVRREGESLRPDLLVHLPGKKCIVVDAKVPLTAYLRAVETENVQEQRKLFEEHADQLRKQVQLLSKKGYWQHFESSPEFVVLFLPGESFLSSALACRPELLEFAAEHAVILATPITLIAMLRAIAYGWRHEASNQHAQQIALKAKELVQRLGTMAEYFQKLGKNLGQAVDGYNQAIASLESRVLVSARQMTDMGEFGAAAQINVLEPLEKKPTC
ncbi:MAG: DNA recombination protein RmuC [Myxococcaceae bacterium]|nr:DNA recombination protein RmuC [Myxococcaceae bacterium]